MDSKPTIDLACPAKVNLALSVGAPDPARGNLHPIASWMVAVNFCDHMTLSTGRDSRSQFDIQFGLDAPIESKVNWPLESDLVWRAHHLLESHVGRSLPVSLRLRKVIPAGAGLGGGSSNAASMMLGLNQLYELDIPPATLMELSRSLGSDVPFLIATATGQSPSALVTGVGEQIEPVRLMELLHLVLIFPGFGCATGPVYRAFDQMNASRPSPHPEVERVRALTQLNPLPQDAPFNDLAQPACVVQPELGHLRDQLRTGLELPVHVTGSGSTLFIVAPSAITAKAIARQVTALAHVPAVAARSM